LHLTSNYFLHFIKGLLMGWMPFKLDLAWCEASQWNLARNSLLRNHMSRQYLTIPINWRSCNFFSCVRHLNIKDSIHINLVTYRLNTLSGDPVSMYQEFYLFCKEFRFGDIITFTLIPAVESLARTISNLRRWSLKLLFLIC
jgi:hypothetical protein